MCLKYPTNVVVLFASPLSDGLRPANPTAYNLCPILTLVILAMPAVGKVAIKAAVADVGARDVF